MNKRRIDEITGSWADIRSRITSISPEEWDQIDFEVRLIGEIIAARKGSGITQAELDALCGVNQTHIARIENKKTDPQLSTILKILKPLGKTLAVVDADSHYATARPQL
jgi:DNA-binding XRE family transcriptional regulator